MLNSVMPKGVEHVGYCGKCFGLGVVPSLALKAIKCDRCNGDRSNMTGATVITVGHGIGSDTIAVFADTKGKVTVAGCPSALAGLTTEEAERLRDAISTAVIVARNEKHETEKRLMVATNRLLPYLKACPTAERARRVGNAIERYAHGRDVKRAGRLRETVARLEAEEEIPF